MNYINYETKLPMIVNRSREIRAVSDIRPVLFALLILTTFLFIFGKVSMLIHTGNGTKIMKKLHMQIRQENCTRLNYGPKGFRRKKRVAMIFLHIG